MGLRYQMSPPLEYLENLQLLFLDRDQLEEAAREALVCSCSPLEHLEAQKFRFEKDRNEFLLTRGFLRQRLGQRLGLLPGSVPQWRDTHKKLHTDGTHFNVSHTQRVSLIGIHNHPLGVDVECINPATATEALMKTVCHSSERKYLTQLNDKDRIKAFFRMWCRKEALLKAIGLGLELDPKAIDSKLEHPVFCFEFNQILYCIQDIHLSDFGLEDLASQFSCAICSSR